MLSLCISLKKLRSTLATEMRPLCAYFLGGSRFKPAVCKGEYLLGATWVDIEVECGGEAGPFFRYMSTLKQDIHSPISYQILVGQSLLGSSIFGHQNYPRKIWVSDITTICVRNMQPGRYVRLKLGCKNARKHRLESYFLACLGSLSWQHGASLQGCNITKNVVYINSKSHRVSPAAAFHHEFPYALDRHPSPCLHDYGGYSGGCFQLHSVNYGPW